MSADVLPLIGGVLTALLGGGLVTGALTYLRDRRKGQDDHELATFTGLQEWNDRLQKRVGELEADVDRERAERRELEDQLAEERRARRSLEARVSALERLVPPEGDPNA